MKNEIEKSHKDAVQDGDKIKLTWKDLMCLNLRFGRRLHSTINLSTQITDIPILTNLSTC